MSVQPHSNGGQERCVGEAAVAARVEEALRGTSGALCVGVTFLAADLICEVRWGAVSGVSGGLGVVACSPFAPDFMYVPVDALTEDKAGLAVESVAACGAIPFVAFSGPLTAIAEEYGWYDSLGQTSHHSERFARALDGALAASVGRLHELASRGARVVVVAEDVAGADGFLVAPDFVIGELMPRFKRLVDEARRVGMRAVWHSDGDTRSLLRAAAAAGFSAVHPGGLRVEAFEALFIEARRVGLVVLGGIPGEALRAGAPAAIRAGVHAALLAMRGGLLVCDDGSIVSSREVVSLVTALEAARGFEVPG